MMNQAVKTKETLIDCRVMCPSYRGFDGRLYKKGSIIQVPESWVEKGTSREAGRPDIIIARLLKPISEEKKELENQEAAPADTKAFDSEVNKLEAWTKLNKQAEQMIQKDQAEAMQRLMAAAAPEKK